MSQKQTIWIYAPFIQDPDLAGHCIPIDPFYLTWKAREYGRYTRFIALAGEVISGIYRKPNYI